MTHLDVEVTIGQTEKHRLKFKLQHVGLGLIAAFLVCSPVKTGAFALLGPVQPWMQATNGVIEPGDIGGPMDIGSGYRWNVPVLTYGFDQSFLNFFGTNGVVAVEGAIKILNDLPPASQIVLTNYPFGTEQLNTAAQAQNLCDLKSETLSFLVEQMGLADPTRNIYVLSDWDPSYFNEPPPSSYILILGIPIFYENDPYGIDPLAQLDPVTQVDSVGVVASFVAGYNFDPNSLTPTPLINNIQYAGNIEFPNSAERYVASFAIQAPSNPTVAGSGLDSGRFFTGLTCDDVGGLAYLLSTNNIHYETLPAGVQGIGTNLFVNGAWRPGVDKIAFVPQPAGLLPGTFLPMTNQFTDTFITNCNAIQQQLLRVTKQPDILFSAGNDSFCTGTTNWMNNAALNGNQTGAGPGTIQPPVVIVLPKFGRYYYNSFSSTNAVTWSEDSVQDESLFFGSFDGSTNTPIVYPVPQSGNISMAVRVFLSHSNLSVNNFQSFEWLPTSEAGTAYALQTSTNLSNWNTLLVVTNNGSVCTYRNVNANSSSRFYRLVPQ